MPPKLRRFPYIHQLYLYARLRQGYPQGVIFSVDRAARSRPCPAPLLYLWRMAKRNKLQKFAEVLSFPNVYENFDPRAPELVGRNGEPVVLKGRWNERHFGRSAPITLELACGGGEYTLELGRRYPERHFIGVDIKGARIWKGARVALAEKLDNVAFLRTRIEQIAYFFAPGEVDEIWITFPDPFLRKSKANRRLTATPFLDRYKQILRPGGVVQLKTDERRLYDFTQEVLAGRQDVRILRATTDLYAEDWADAELGIKTYYENLHIAPGDRITYLQFRLG